MDLSGARWRKSSRSGSDGGSCIEVATNLFGVVAVRDSKDLGGSVLVVPADCWRSFVVQVKGMTE
ncbi:DUF397 domain-containing protein [Sphaerisporangium corydalis]|uniref:DUF397 domain-containing protein n=1 Tax=Sphaerisporangium corydalis TaxID=1441875 RepID=A0ABV9ENV0_9ACTN|nr:DUF397 domain-containing protein [Sphaerisporangium corydalis]